MTRASFSNFLVWTEALLVVVVIIFMINVRVCSKGIIKNETEQLSLKNFSIFIRNPMVLMDHFPETPQLEAKLYKYFMNTISDLDKDLDRDIVEICLLQNHQIIVHAEKLTSLEKKRSKVCRKIINYLGDELEDFENLESVIFRMDVATIKKHLSFLDHSRYPKLDNYYSKLEKIAGTIKLLLNQELDEGFVKGAYVVFANIKTAKIMKKVHSSSKFLAFAAFVYRLAGLDSPVY